MITTYRIAEEALAEQVTAVIRAELPFAELPAWLPKTYQSVGRYLNEIGMAPAGPPFARYAQIGDRMAVEAGFPVPAEVPGSGDIEPSALPEGPAAVTVHVGDYDGLGSAVETVHTWLAERGLEAAGPHWEVYLTDPSTGAAPVTRVVVPFRHG